MDTEPFGPATTPCLYNALRQATRAVGRIYDEELRGVGLRTTQFSLLRRLARTGEIRQRDLGRLMVLDETTLTRNLRPLVLGGWVLLRSGDDRREKRIALTPAGIALLDTAAPAWQRAQERLKALLPPDLWERVMPDLHTVARTAAET